MFWVFFVCFLSHCEIFAPPPPPPTFFPPSYFAVIITLNVRGFVFGKSALARELAHRLSQRQLSATGSLALKMCECLV